MTAFERTTLPNGLRVLTATVPQAQSVSCFVMLAAGSRFETRESNGIAHFAEHMFFKGTERRPTARDIAGEVDAIGWDVIGRKETVQGATRETFLDYLGQWYKPSRMVVGVGGRTGDGLLERIEELLGGLDDAPTGSPLPAQLLPNGSRVKVHTKASDQAHIILGVRSRPIVDPDRYVLMVLSTVLGGGMSSRLFTEVRERRGLAYYVFATNHAYTDAGSLYSQAGVDIERIDEAIETIAAELKKMATEPVPEDELRKAKNFAKGRFVLQIESPHGLLMFGIRREVLEGRAPEPEEVLAGIEAVTAEDVQRVAQELIRDEAIRLAVIGPFEDADRFEKLLT